MDINDINIEELTKEINNQEKFMKRRDNGLLLTDEQINILDKYNINYNQYNSLSSLIYEIEEYLNDDECESDDLEWVSKELSEINYYQNTNK